MSRIIILFTIVCCLIVTAPLRAQTQTQPSVAPSTTPNANQPKMASGEASKPETMTDIYDIKPLETAGVDSMLFVWIAAGVIIIALLIFLVVFLWKRRKRKQAKAAPPIPPEKAALTALNRIDLLIEKDPKQFYFKLSEILRTYLHARFDLDALEMTTEELAPQIAVLNLDKQLKNDLKALFYNSDPVKFAGQAADRQKMQTDYRFAQDFVNQTTPSVSEQ